VYENKQIQENMKFVAYTFIALIFLVIQIAGLVNDHKDRFHEKQVSDGKKCTRFPNIIQLSLFYTRI